MADMIEITGLWLNESKDGKTRYMTGYFGSARILIFRNDHKTEDKHPDYSLFVATNENRNETSAETEDVPF